MAVLEDLYLPFRPKRRTRATIAREKGLEPLAKQLMAQHYDVRPELVSRKYISDEKGVADEDAALAGADGVALARQLKADRQTSDLVILLALDKEAQKRFSIEDALGVDDYVTKPYNLPMVMIRVETLIRKRRNVNALKVGEEPLGDTSYTDELTGLRNRRYLLERLQEEA